MRLSCLIRERRRPWLDRSSISAHARRLVRRRRRLNATCHACDELGERARAPKNIDRHGTDPDRCDQCPYGCPRPDRKLRRRAVLFHRPTGCAHSSTSPRPTGVPWQLDRRRLGPMPDPKDAIIAIFGASAALPGLLLVFSAFIPAVLNGSYGADLPSGAARYQRWSYPGCIQLREYDSAGRSSRCTQ